MTVARLIDILQGFDPAMPVAVYSLGHYTSDDIGVQIVREHYSDGYGRFVTIGDMYEDDPQLDEDPNETAEGPIIR